MTPLPPRIAAIDLGTNTFRLVSRGLQAIEYPRIGVRVDQTGRISPASFRRGLRALDRFHRIVRARNLRVVGVVGTSALRDAQNGPDFSRAVLDKFGWTVRIISGQEEAELTFLGATAALSLPAGENVLISDVGGGSTELIWGRPGRPGRSASIDGCVSLELGSVRMTERFGTQGRIPRPKLSRLMASVRAIIQRAPPPKVPWKSIRAVVGVGGTATTLAAILHGVDPYDEKMVHAATVPLDSMAKILEVIALMTPRERMDLPGVPRGRADIIVAGTAIQSEIVRMAAAPHMIASDCGILTGLILRSQTLARRRQKV